MAAVKGSRPVTLMLKGTSYLHTDRYYVTIAEKLEAGVPISGWSGNLPVSTPGIMRDNKWKHMEDLPVFTTFSWTM